MIINQVITETQILHRADFLAGKVLSYWDKEDFVTIGILNGCMPWLSALRASMFRQMGDSRECIDYDFYATSSYNGETEGGSQLIITQRPSLSLKGMNVLLVDDIADSGRTLNAITDLVYAEEPNEVLISTLLDKPSGRTAPLRQPIAFVGFEVPESFYIGYGLDYGFGMRGLPYVAQLVETE